MPFINCVKVTPQAKPLFAVAGASKRVKSCMTKKEISNGRNKCLRFAYTLFHKMSIIFQKNISATISFDLFEKSALQHGVICVAIE